MTLNLGRFRSEETRMRVLARTAGILAYLEPTIRCELADRIPPKTAPPRRQHEIAAYLPRLDPCWTTVCDRVAGRRCTCTYPATVPRTLLPSSPGGMSEALC
jgi:hypothetical protein